MNEQTYDSCEICEHLYPSGTAHGCPEVDEPEEDDVDVIIGPDGKAYRDYWQGPELMLEGNR